MFAKLHLLSQDQPEAGRAGDTSAAPYGGLTVTFQPRQHRTTMAARDIRPARVCVSAEKR
jgi:hypothetical protein